MPWMEQREMPPRGMAICEFGSEKLPLHWVGMAVDVKTRLIEEDRGVWMVAEAFDGDGFLMATNTRLVPWPE